MNWQAGGVRGVPWRHALAPLGWALGITLLQHLLLGVAQGFEPRLRFETPFPGLPLHLFTTWDAEHYLKLARVFDVFAWPPLYPLTLRALGMGMSLVQAAAVVNLLSHVAIAYLCRALVDAEPRLSGASPALLTWLLLFWPGHDVFFAAYSESLFLALSLGAVVAWYRDRPWVGSLLCGLAVLTRNMGMFLGLGMVVAETWAMAAQRKWSARRLVAVSAWALAWMAWTAWLKFVVHTDPVDATRAWQAELLRHHVPEGDSPIGWVLEYLFLPGHKEWLFAWAAVVAGAWCWTQGLRREALYVAFFLGSHLVYLYRPFPFTRYVSVLFPVALAVTAWLRRTTGLQFLVAGAALLFSLQHQARLFLMQMGEP